MSIETQCHVGCLIVNKVAGRLAKPFQQEVERFLAKNGPEWTSNRLKSVWNAALHLKEGKPDLAVKVYQANSISYRYKDGLPIPKGPIGSIALQFVLSKKPSSMRRWAAVLRFYTGIRLPNNGPSKKQYEKARESINSPQHVEDSNELSALYQVFHEFIVKELKGKEPPKLDWDYADGKHLRGTVKYYAPVSVPRRFGHVPYSSMVLSLLMKPWVPPSLSYDTPCKEMREEYATQQVIEDPYCGKIAFLQEAGCKGRVVFQPTAYLQLSFLPLKKALKQFTERYYHRWACTTHQTDGGWFALNSLNSGRDIISVDLSSATDRFPLRVQLDILDALGYREYSKALVDVVSMPVRARALGHDEAWSYACGQPMGLNGSFDLFALANLLLCKYSAWVACSSYLDERRKRLPRLQQGVVLSSPPGADGPAKSLTWDEIVQQARDHFNNSFRVLGDDVIFNDPSVAAIYSRNLHTLGVEVQETKCFSGKVGEFAGFVFLPTREGYTAFRPYKHPTGFIVTNPKEFLYSLGIQSVELSSKWLRRFADFSHTVPMLDLDLSPFDPLEEDYGQTASVRADNSWVISLCQQFRNEPRLQNVLPTIQSEPSGRVNLAINRKPLFKERGPFDWYGFNPEAYKKADVSPYEREGLSILQVERSFDRSPVFKQWRQGYTNTELLQFLQPLKDRVEKAKRVQQPRSHGDSGFSRS